MAAASTGAGESAARLMPAAATTTRASFPNIEVMIFHPIKINKLKICRGYGVTVIDQVGCSPLVPKAVSTMIVCFGSH